jgi:hypothetical protein
LDSFNSRLDDSLRKRAQELRRLTSMLRGELPPESDGHYHVANIHDRTVVIMTDSPVWTTRLRQLGPRILTILQNSGRKNLLHIRVFSRPAQSPVARPPESVKTKPRHISPQSSRLLNQAASAIGDEGLRDALLKLARHASDRHKPENQGNSD